MALVAVSVFLFSYMAALCLEVAGKGEYRRTVSFYVISLGLSVAASLAFLYANRNRFFQTLMDIDSRLNLDDTIATAYEYESREKSSVFKPQLMENAVRKMANYSIPQLLPGHYSYIHAILAFLILANGFLLFMDRFSFASKEADPAYESVKNEIQLPKQFRPRKKKALRKKTPEPSPKSNRTLEKFAQKLNQPTMTRERMVSALNEMLQEIQSDNTLLAKDANPTTQTGNVDRQSIQSIQKKQNLSLQRLKDLFKGILSENLSERIATESVMLEERERFEKLLSQIIDSIDRMESDRQKVSGSSDKSASKTSRQRSDKKQKGKGAGNDPNDVASESNAPGDDLAGGSGRGQDPDFWGDGEDYREDWGDFSDSPGHAKSKRNQNASDTLESKKGPALQDKTISAVKDDYSVHIRSLTSIGKATVEQKDIPREYYQEIESILQKEDIPLNYREYIRNYFISIGLRKDEK